MNNFEELCESFGVIKTVKRERYPKEIQLSEEFLEALKKEYYKLKLEESSEKPIRNYSDKFNKALRFEIASLNENLDDELEVMRQRFEEQNDERVPEVDVEGEDMPELPHNKATEDPKCKKQRRLVLQRNTTKDYE